MGEELVSKIASWIDTQLIAEAIVDHIRNELGEEPTLVLAKQVWLEELRRMGVKLIV